MELWEKLNPSKRGFSPKMTAIVGAILNHDYGVRDRKGGQLTAPLSITSDGFVITGSTAHDSGAFIGDARDLERNIQLLLSDPDITDANKEEWAKFYRANVTDWRSIKGFDRV